MFDKILVPTDGSTGMNRVIQQASGLADVHDAELHFIYAIHTASFTNLSMETSWESVGMIVQEDGEAALSAAERRATVDRIETSLLEGPPSTKIIEYADDVGCDLIVMGTHGRGGLNRLLLGSVAERVVRSATIPVMTIRVGGSEHSAVERSDSKPAAEGPSATEAIE